MPVSAIDLATIADFSLGGIRVRPSLREAVSGDETHVLEPRVMQVLALLARHRGQTVSRDQMVEHCWGGVIVGEDSIQRCIGRLRKLADTTRAFEIITLSRIGYRLNEADRQAEPQGKLPERLLAVLPFDNLSNDPDFDYVAEGVSEEILQSIGRNSTIKVIGRTSSFQYRGADKVITRIADELGATHLLDGSVRHAGGRLRVSAQLTELGEQTMIWSDRFDGDSSDPFELQDRVATATVQALNGVFEVARPVQPLSGEAFEAFLKLRSAVHAFSIENAVAFDADALIADVERLCPGHADALGLIAQAHAYGRWLVDDEAEPRLRKAAIEAADRALSIDPACGHAHLARVVMDLPSSRFLASGTRLETVHAASPNNSEILFSLVIHYWGVGRMRDGVRVAEEAYRIDPMNPGSVLHYALALNMVGQRRQSVSLLQHAIERWPDNPMLFGTTLWTAVIEGEESLARSLLRDGWQDRFSESWQYLLGGIVLLATGVLEKSDGLADQVKDLLDLSIASGIPNIGVIGAFAYVGGDLDALYNQLDRSSFDRLSDPATRFSPLQTFTNLFLRANFRLRQSPRFVHLCARLGLVEYWRTTGHWPDCVSEVAPYYDFKAEALKLA